MTEAKWAEGLEGVIGALAVPMFEDGEIDYSLLERQAAYYGGSGVRGLFLGGTNGEGAYLTTEEKARILRTVRAAVPKDKILCAACIRPSTREVLAEMKVLGALGPDYIVAVAPYYLAVNQDAILRHFRTLAQASPVPLIPYNIPQNTHNPMSLETIQELAAVPNIAGIKDSSGDFISFTRGVLGPRPGPFTWIQGEDLLDAPSYLLGTKAVVTGLSNVSVEPYVDMWKAARAGDAEGVKTAQRRINEVFRIVPAAGGKGIPAIKAAMELLGRGRRHLRLAALTLDDAEVESVRKVLVEVGLL